MQPKQEKWYRERNEKIARLSNGGAPVCYLSDRFGLTDYWIRHILREQKCTVNSR